MSRVIEVAHFLDINGWSEAQHTAFPADFSPRRYARMECADGSRAILMDADPDQKTHQFVCVAKLLHALDLRAPEIFAADPEKGFVLMEDFGDRNMGALLDIGADAEGMQVLLPLAGGVRGGRDIKLDYYADAARLLAHLHRRFNPSMISGAGLPIFDSRYFVGQVELFLDYYVPFALNREVDNDERDDFCAAWLAVLRPLDTMKRTLVLRDFMPDNVMLLDGQTYDQRFGLLDFQDAGLGPIAYDLASFCEVVRRDGGDAQLDTMLEIYILETQMEMTKDDLKRAAIVLSAQRHMRILGIIARMAQKGRIEKTIYLPRIKNYLKELLHDRALMPVKLCVEKFLNNSSS